MKQYSKLVDITYFVKEKEIGIDESLGKIVYIEVKSPLRYGIRTWAYYGRITKVTSCYFEILEYCYADVDYWYTNEIEKKEKKELTKKWAKKSIRKIYSVQANNKREKRDFYSN